MDSWRTWLWYPFRFLLMAGENYTTFTFLGASGYTYGKGAPAFYILGYGCLAFIMSYWMLPAVWKYAKSTSCFPFPISLQASTTVLPWVL